MGTDIGRENRKHKLLKAVAKVFAGITVDEFNRKFSGRSEEEIIRYLNIVCAERAQGVDL